MRSSPMPRFAALLAALTLLALSAAPVAAAKPARPPANDSIATPIVIGTFPYTNSQNTVGATTGATDPAYCGLPEVGQDRATVWYSYTPTDSTAGSIGATTYGSDYDTTLYVGTPDGAGGINVIGCADDTGSTAQTAVRFDAVAGQTYLFMVGTCCGTQFEGPGGGNLVFNLDVAPPAMVVDLTVEPTGTFTRAGTAIIRGTVSCTAPGDLGAIVIVELTQSAGFQLVQGVAFHDVEGCPDSGIPFEIEVVPESGTFVGGPVDAQVITAVCNLFECGNETIDLTIRLRR
jgi:hypothetical protein